MEILGPSKFVILLFLFGSFSIVFIIFITKWARKSNKLKTENKALLKLLNEKIDRLINNG